MARPIKKGIDYFAIDVTFNQDFEILIARYKNEGIGIWLRLLQYIYSTKGYYCDYNEDFLFIMSTKLNIEYDYLEEFLKFLIDRDIFNKQQFNLNKILTSERIQHNYYEATMRRKVHSINENYVIIKELKSLCQQKTELMSTITTSNDTLSTQIRLDEIKEKRNNKKKNDVKASTSTGVKVIRNYDYLKE